MTYHVKLQFAAKTDTGLMRSHNEDSIAIGDAHGIAVLADGMGGYNAGEVASGIATSIFKGSLEQRLQDSGEGGQGNRGKRFQQWMAESIASANAKILEAAQSEPQYRGMGTTMVAALFHHDKVTVAHVGDSRAYRWRQGSLVQLTRDHSQLQEQIDAGLVSPQWARFAPNKNLITRAVGVEEIVDVEISEYPTEAADIYLLCSDGLSDMLSSDEISAVLTETDFDLDLACSALVESANHNGGRDNISVVLAKVQPGKMAVQGLFDRLRKWAR